MDILELLQSAWLWRGIVASSLVGIMCGALGCFIVLRNMALIGDALAHAILPGVVIAFIIFGYSIAGFFLGSVVAGLVTAIAITWVQQKIKTKNDSAIGIIFTAMFSLGVIGISFLSKHEGVHLDLTDFLFGKVLAVSNSDLILTFVVCFYVIISLWYFYRYFFITTFQPTIAKTMGMPVRWIHYFLMILLSFAVVASLQTVGVILVVAMLITPSSAAMLWSDKLKKVIILSSTIGLLSAVLGFIASVQFDFPPGPAMAIAATIMYFLSAIFAPEKGFLARYQEKKKLRIQILQEDIIKNISKTHNQQQSSTLETISSELNTPIHSIKTAIKRLVRQGLLLTDYNNINLTSKGKESALKLIRNHRLWETFLVNEIGLSNEQVHISAENQEHYMTDEIAEELNKRLGYPDSDPHGSPIPQLKKVIKSRAISDLEISETAIVSSSQFHYEAVEFLIKNNIEADTTLTLISKNKVNESFNVMIGQMRFDVNTELAKKIELE